MDDLNARQKPSIRQMLPLSLDQCPKGHVPVVEDGSLNFMRRDAYLALVAQGSPDIQSVH